jgi:hypothetical protein
MREKGAALMFLVVVAEAGNDDHALASRDRSDKKAVFREADLAVCEDHEFRVGDVRAAGVRKLECRRIDGRREVDGLRVRAFGRVIAGRDGPTSAPAVARTANNNIAAPPGAVIPGCIFTLVFPG